MKIGCGTVYLMKFILKIWVGGSQWVLEKQKIEFMLTYITYYMFFIQYCNFYLFWIFLFGWSILKKSGKSGYFRYLFLHFKSSSLLGENVDAPCWELRIDLSKSHTHKMFWFMEKIGNFLSRWPIKPFSQNFSLSALHQGGPLAC